MRETGLLVGTERDEWMGTSGVPWHARHVWSSICRRNFGTYMIWRICRSPVLNKNYFKGLIRFSRYGNFRNLAINNEYRPTPEELKEFCQWLLQPRAANPPPTFPRFNRSFQPARRSVTDYSWCNSEHPQSTVVRRWVQHGIMSREKWSSVNV